MIAISISVSREKVRERAKELIANIAQKAEIGGADGAFDRITAIDSENEMLEKWEGQAAGSLRICLGGWLNSYSYEEAKDPTVSVEVVTAAGTTEADASGTGTAGTVATYNYSLRMPDNWQKDLWSELGDKCENFMVTEVVKSWMEMVKEGDTAAEYAAKGVITCMEIESILLQRSRPYRTIVNNYKKDEVWLEED